MQIGSLDSSTPVVAPSPPSPSPEQLAENRELVKAVKALDGTTLFGQNNELTFVFDRETRRPLLRIVDRETREVIRQIPPEQILRLAAELSKTDAKSSPGAFHVRAEESQKEDDVQILTPVVSERAGTQRGSA
jgi:uncharacterized FlaG/YvyC family protein